MQRIIIDYKKLTPEILTLLSSKFPDGYGDNDIISFKSPKNELIDAVEVRTDDYVYLVKIGSKLVYTMANFDLDDDDEGNALDDIETPDLNLNEEE